jgi:alanine racemase
MKNLPQNLRTWIEIDSREARKNYNVFRKLVGPHAKLWAVVKSNAYGHGLMLFAKLMQKFGVDGFCVDSLVEGIRLREEGIKKPILVLGPTLPSLYGEAAKNKITVSVSNFDALKSLAGTRQIPEFHLKIDTGMHRQGFYVDDLGKVIRLITDNLKLKTKLTGIFTHFASAKDINYPTHTENQFKKFEKAEELLEKSGFKNLVKHCAATGATLINPKYHMNAVRVGIGLYGLWPSKELETQLGAKIKLKPILSWHAAVSEVKKLKPGDYVGYDLAERVLHDTKMAVIPIGYWHGFPRALSHVGEAIVSGRRARVLGRVSMDLVTLNVNGVKCETGTEVVLIGRGGNEEILAAEIAQKSGTIHYEFLARLNPLIERILI